MRTPRPGEFVLAASASGQDYEALSQAVGTSGSRGVELTIRLLEGHPVEQGTVQSSVAALLHESPGSVHRSQSGGVHHILVDSLVRAEAQVWRQVAREPSAGPITVVKIVETIETTWDLTPEQLAAVGPIDAEDADSSLALIDSGIEPSGLVVMERDITVLAQLGEDRS